jgi:hypothetical protein
MGMGTAESEDIGVELLPRACPYSLFSFIFVPDRWVKTEQKETHERRGVHPMSVSVDPCPVPHPKEKEKKKSSLQKTKYPFKKKTGTPHTRHSLHVHLSPCRVEELLGSRHRHFRHFRQASSEVNSENPHWHLLHFN